MKIAFIMIFGPKIQFLPMIFQFLHIQFCDFQERAHNMMS